MTIVSSFFFFFPNNKGLHCIFKSIYIHDFFALYYHYILGINLLFFDKWLNFKKHAIKSLTPLPLEILKRFCSSRENLEKMDSSKSNGALLEKTVV